VFKTGTRDLDAAQLSRRFVSEFTENVGVLL